MNGCGGPAAISYRECDQDGFPQRARVRKGCPDAVARAVSRLPSFGGAEERWILARAGNGDALCGPPKFLREGCRRDRNSNPLKDRGHACCALVAVGIGQLHCMVCFRSVQRGSIENGKTTPIFCHASVNVHFSEVLDGGAVQDDLPESPLSALSEHYQVDLPVRIFRRRDHFTVLSGQG